MKANCNIAALLLDFQPLRRTKQTELPHDSLFTDVIHELNTHSLQCNVTKWRCRLTKTHAHDKMSLILNNRKWKGFVMLKLFSCSGFWHCEPRLPLKRLTSQEPFQSYCSGCQMAGRVNYISLFWWGLFEAHNRNFLLTTRSLATMMFWLANSASRLDPTPP